MKSWVEISSARLVSNVRAVQSAAGAGADVLAVIKADGYGHTAGTIAPVLARAGVGWMGVTDLEEGARVRACLGEGSTRLLVMVGMEAGDAPGMVLNGLTPAIWTAEHIAAMDRAARSAGQRVAVHVEVDTGMARQGAAPGDDLRRVLERLAETRYLECEGVFTHLCESEVAGSAVTLAQRERFATALEQVAGAGLHPRWVHVANSSGVDEGSTLPWVKRLAKGLGARPMVRAGYAIYGHALPLVGEDAESHLQAKLNPVLEWKTRVVGLREIQAGDTVGYGATFRAEQPMRLALLPVGYADGFRRAASSGVGDGWVMVRGQRAAVVGRVSMNVIVVDVTGMDGVQVGEEVTLLGPGVSAEDHARWAGTIGYDILCGIRARVELR